MDGIIWLFLALIVALVALGAVLVGLLHLAGLFAPAGRSGHEDRCKRSKFPLCTSASAVSAGSSPPPVNAAWIKPARSNAPK
jgi:hypothetical protein